MELEFTALDVIMIWQRRTNVSCQTCPWLWFTWKQPKQQTLRWCCLAAFSGGEQKPCMWKTDLGRNEQLTDAKRPPEKHNVQPYGVAWCSLSLSHTHTHTHAQTVLDRWGGTGWVGDKKTFNKVWDSLKSKCLDVYYAHLDLVTSTRKRSIPEWQRSTEQW